MTKQIEDYTVDELSAKINAIKAERERTENALKRYEEELERRKQEVPLGVPCDGGEDTYNCTITISPKEGRNIFVLRYYFSSEESARKHAEMLFDWSKDGLVANSKGEPIDVQVLLPLLKKGWVAYEKEYGWIWFKNKPSILRGTEEDATWVNEGSYSIIGGFNLKPAENWEESLQECGL